MSEISAASYHETLENYFGAEELENLSDEDLQALFEQLISEGEAAMEAEMKTQFDKNFQTTSYLFLREIYTYADDELRRL